MVGWLDRCTYNQSTLLGKKTCMVFGFVLGLFVCLFVLNKHLYSTPFLVWTVKFLHAVSPYGIGSISLWNQIDRIKMFMWRVRKEIGSDLGFKTRRAFFFFSQDSHWDNFGHFNLNLIPGSIRLHTFQWCSDKASKLQFVTLLHRRKRFRKMILNTEQQIVHSTLCHPCLSHMFCHEPASYPDMQGKTSSWQQLEPLKKTALQVELRNSNSLLDVTWTVMCSSSGLCGAFFTFF